MAKRKDDSKGIPGVRKSRKPKGRMVGGTAVDEKDLKYVSSRGILKSCDVIPSDISSSTKTASIDIASIKDGSVVYVHGSAIPDFVGKLPSVNAKFILVSGDCDESVPDDVFPSDDDFKKFIESDKIIHWFSQNAVKEHPKLTKIPIGVYYHTLPDAPGQEKELISVKDNAKRLADREVKCYSNFHFSMRPDREDAMNKVPKDLVYYEPTRVSISDTWKNQAKYAFVLSPHGNGLDCHRTWEALCLGCIPIVKTSPIDSVFDGLPVLIVKEWSDVTNELLEKTLKGFGKKEFKCDRLTLAYWMGLVRSKKGRTGGGRAHRYSRKATSKGHPEKNVTRNRKAGHLRGGDGEPDTRGQRGEVVPEPVVEGPRRAVVAVLNSKGGFFAVFFTLVRAYLYSKKQNIPFFVDHDNWTYTFKDGWHDYFKSLAILDKSEQFDTIERFENGATNSIMDELTVGEIIEGLKEVFVLNDDIENAINAYYKQIGGDYSSLYVRRGDKITEMPLVPLDNILAQTTITDDGSKIFVQTDDYSVVTDMRKKFPSCEIVTLTKETELGSNNADMVNWTPEQRKEHTEELLKSCVITTKAIIGWTYNMSNVGTFIKLFGYDIMRIYTDDRFNKDLVDMMFSLDTKYKDQLAIVGSLSV
jgi:hypothetical protein